MTTRIRLTRSPAYWALVLVSALMIAAGAVLAVPRITTMERTLTDMTATGVEVYAGQAWVTLAAALVGAGGIGLLLALAIAAAKALVLPRTAATDTPRPEDEPVADGTGTDEALADERDADDEAARPAEEEPPLTRGEAAPLESRTVR
jgi:threonine dehydrogenase-like Zn-dependent dehydrogenase